MNDLIAILGVVVLFLPIVALLGRGATKTERLALWLSALSHLLAALAMVFLTNEVLGGGDMNGYHKFGSAVAGLLRQDFRSAFPHLVNLLTLSDEPSPFHGAIAGSTTGAMQGFASLLMLALNDSLWAAAVLIGGGACVSKWLIYRVCSEELPAQRGLPLLIPTLFIPSLVFWSSGMLKEPLALVGFGWLLFGAYRLAVQRRWWGLPLAALGALLVLALKPYWLPPFAVAAALWQGSRLLARSKRDVLGSAGALVLTAGFAVALVFGTGLLFPEYELDSLEEQILAQQAIGTRVTGGSGYVISGVSLATAPLSLLTALYRPALFDVNNAMMGVNALETTAFALASLWVLLRRGPLGALRATLASPPLVFAFVFTITYGVAVGLATTNYGTLSRYRLPLVPFFALFLASLARGQQHSPQRAPQRALRLAPRL